MGDGRLRDLVAYWGWTVFSFTKWNFFVLTNAFLDLKKRNPLVLTTATEARTGKKAKVLISKTTILHVYQAFLYISLLSLQSCDVEMSNFTVSWRTWTQDNDFLIFFWTLIQPFWIQLQKTRWNKGDKAVWSSENALFKWRFCSRRFRFCLSSLIPLNNAQTTFARQLVASCQIWFKNPVGERGEDLWASTS